MANSDPKRFQASKATLIADRFMTQFIKVGGAMVIVAVFGIFVFILTQIIPLFKGASVKEIATYQLPAAKYGAIGADEWSELPFLASKDGTIEFVSLPENGKITKVDPQFNFAQAEAPQLSGVPAPDQTQASPTKAREDFFTSVQFDAGKSQVIYGTANGYIVPVSIQYTPKFENGKRTIAGTATAGNFLKVGNGAIFALDLSEGSDSSLVAALQKTSAGTELHATLLTRKRAGLGGGAAKFTPAGEFNLTSMVQGNPTAVLVDSTARAIVVATESGEITYLYRTGTKFVLIQRFVPFEDKADKKIATLDFIFGDASLVVASTAGENRIFSLYRKENEPTRTFGLTKVFPSLDILPSFFDASLRNKAFLIGGGDLVSLRYGTTESIRWQQTVPFKVERGLISGKYNRLLLADSSNKLHIYDLNDPHPDVSFKGLFGKVWYEGYSAPSYEWQSTGGSDEFEPKYSLVPLIIGTLKGTFYAMLFAVPIALAAAIYTSQFLHPRFKATIKPMMEIMASLPSVVLGFLAALWLAPLIETRVPSLLCMVVLIPGTAFLFGYLWSRLPLKYRNGIKPGYEFFVFFPILICVAWFCWNLGPTIEAMFFKVTLPDGKVVHDFRLWWPSVTGAPFEQRNSLVVGFAMGFAVIPIIFTIAEDSLSNVPPTLRSASLALGASRWQTTMRVILPTASPGIFSALMIGLGRAVGETMIVVMATGNTPITDFNIFSGMRTLAANIAVELPEAPHSGTLYRTLFLGAMMLFMMTFVVNTIAEVIRQNLREKYKTV